MKEDGIIKKRRGKKCLRKQVLSANIIDNSSVLGTIGNVLSGIVIVMTKIVTTHLASSERQQKRRITCNDARNFFSFKDDRERHDRHDKDRHDASNVPHIMTHEISFSVLGTIGNVLSGIVMTRPTMRRSTMGLMLCVLAVFDTLVLWTDLLRQYVRYVHHVDLRTHSNAVCKLYR